MNIGDGSKLPAVQASFRIAFQELNRANEFELFDSWNYMENNVYL
jgi:hypothetical protein